MECWLGPMSPASRNLKAEAIADAHRRRVEAEVNAYLLAESRKTEARAGTAEVKSASFALLLSCLVLKTSYIHPSVCVFSLTELLMV